MQASNFGSLPNLITLLRLVLVPAIVAMIASQRWVAACLIFLVAGLSDAADGWIAKQFNLRTELGAYLDPLADKALLVSIYVALAITRTVPVTLTIIIVARDLMIIGAFMVAWLLQKPMRVEPLLISKLNTAAQIAFAALVLGIKAFALSPEPWFGWGVYGVALLTLVSMAAYFWRWIHHMEV
ncbi:CDP-alcohol phosphatidyltransferase family protein [Beijerinckia indica]|uniref:CDP-diacylglycerol--glycerol-3-phosphate 3-phosphatidyltransferase n=1 Tax=Beijerinckia indica subsp. indica (strain ATCC 9039 / DSM 1715 / NCIMB 8712) TaxID=395963 RepID=B2IJR5_BEII9|nr:CDP-alcohol phosphatidyltransferase family protein [Beijerinckia indica]ACB94937.1 CDP-alcohol phosphatidyltransferase [Beijerinckia indica subsp. indica ATCC 9039]